MVKSRRKRDIQGKFALKNDDYREVRSLRLTDNTWKAFGIASECLGLTRPDYLEEMVRNALFPCNTRKNKAHLPCNTWQGSESLPSITWYEQEIERLQAPIQNLQENNSALVSQAALTFVQDVVDF